ncbi:MAG: hypothetical protein GF405_06300 [Candidatus Eisenbacteria bacterium]|nr:hypothetical protein [Candidatus Eisenbacteria bacterium]
MTSRTSWSAALVAAVLVLAVAAAPLAAVEFTADMILTVDDEASEMKVYWGGDHYRIDSAQGGQESILIVDTEAHETTALMPAAKLFVTMDSKAMANLVNDPFEAFRQKKAVSFYGHEHGDGCGHDHHAHADSTEAAMVDTIEGYEVERIELRNAGGLLMTVWLSEDLGVPLRFVVPYDERREVALRNIEVGEVDDALFVVPEDYKSMGSPAKPSEESDAPEQEKQEE